MSRRRGWIVYAITNTKNAKTYVGITTRTIRARWHEHVKDARDGSTMAIHRAMRKYGADAFITSEVARAADDEELLEVEQEIVSRLNGTGTRTPHGYNVSRGGRGCLGVTRSPETRAKLSAAMKVRMYRTPPEQLAAMHAKLRGVPRPADAQAKHRAWVESPVGRAHHAKRMRAVVAAGVLYPSLAAAATACGVTSGAVVARIRNGWPGYHYAEEGQRAQHHNHRGCYRRPVCVGGRTFPSAVDAAHAVGLPASTIAKRIECGWRGYYYADEEQRPRRARGQRVDNVPVEIRGVRYKTSAEACRATGEGRTKVRKRCASVRYPEYRNLDAP